MMTKVAFEVAGITATPGTKATGFIPVEGTNVQMPVTVVNGRESGPTVLVTAGVHGGEYPGIQAAISFAAELDPSRVRGQAIIIHIVSPLAFQARQQYVVPQDGKNPNRNFPGSRLGTVAERMAHTVMSEAAARSDAWVDLHGGDIHEALIPFTIYSQHGPAGVRDRARGMAEVYGIEYVLESDSVKGATYGAAAAQGIPCILTEAGGCGQLDEESTQIHLQGLRNVFAHLGVLPGEPTPVKPIKPLTNFPWLRAAEAGCWYPTVKVGATVTKGQPVGELRDYFGRTLSSYEAPVSGVVIFVVTSLAVNVDDPLVAIGAS
jgi:predicted deacylase